MKKEKSVTQGVSLPQSKWEAIDKATGGRHGGRSQFVAAAVDEKLVGKPDSKKGAK